VSGSQTVALGELMAAKPGSVDPSRYPDEVFDLYSIPAFDLGEPEVVAGKSIGSTKQLVQPGDVLLSRIVPHIRRSWVVGEARGRRTIASGEWIVFRNDRIHPRYLRHVLVGDPFHAQFMRTVSGVGGSLLRARPVQVAKIEIQLPKLPVQQRIAEVLDRADALRAKRCAALAQLEHLTQAIFLDLFGDFKSILEKWDTRPLGGMLEFLTSGSRGWAKYYAESGDLFLRIQNVQSDRLALDDIAYVKAPDSAEARRTRVQPGDVLLSITADLGRSGVFPDGLGPAFINQHLAILRTRVLVPRFLSAYLASPAGQRQVLGRNRQGVKAGLNFDDIRSLVVPVPPIEMQCAFERRVDALERLEQKHQASLAELDALFASLQYRAFRGEL
jgi:type I restriction enzyme, S subunit